MSELGDRLKRGRKPSNNGKGTVDAPTADKTPTNAANVRVVSTSAPPIPWKPFPLGVLPESVRRFVDAAARSKACDPSYVALATLTALAAAIGNSRNLKLRRDWREPAVIWGVLIGESGEGKSPALDAPLEPIMRRQGVAMREHATKLIQYQQDKDVYEMQMKAWKNKKQKAEGEKPPVAPLPPVCERFWVSDTTTEALALRLCCAPRGLLLYREELAGWLRSFGQYKGGKGADEAHYLAMHGARPVLVDRKTGDKTTIYVPRAFLGILGGIQPEVFREALAREHFQDGLAARLLPVMPPPIKRRWTEAEIHPDLEAALAKIFDRLYEMEVRIDPATEAPVPSTLTLTPDGKAAWIEFYDQHEEEMAELTGDLRSAWAKLRSYAARFALVLHLTRVAAGDTSRDPMAVDVQSMNAGVELARWFGNETKRVYAVLSEGEEERGDRQLCELIQRKGGTITVRELQRSSRQYAYASLAEEALGLLVKCGRATRAPIASGPAGGRATNAYRLVDRVDADTTSKNDGKDGVSSTVSASTDGNSTSEEECEWTK